jgi:sulfite reductase (NADPH) flavoprotein alpha-component
MHSYFGYGANMSARAFAVKGVESHGARIAIARGWKLVFAVDMVLPSEGHFASIAPRRANDPSPPVQGILHDLDDQGLANMDRFEGVGHNYRRITVPVETAERVVDAQAYVVLPKRERVGRPSQRYLNLLVEGARAHGIEADYVTWLADREVYPVRDPGPFDPVRIPKRQFAAAELAERPELAAVYGVVVDLSDAEPFLRRIFGGTEISVLTLGRMDTSDGAETLEQVAADRLTDAQRAHLHRSVHDLATVGHVVGSFRYD